MKYPVYERFVSFQGEGVHLGRKAFFIRLYGCPIKCPWCDSAGTWHPEWSPDNVDRIDDDQLVREVSESRASMVVITGGEPTIFDLFPLTEKLKLRLPHVSIHLETSGAFPIRGKVDWITLSPKKWKMPLSQNVAQADEYKIIVEDVGDVGFYCHYLLTHGYVQNPKSPWIWIHPEWGKREDKQLLDSIVSLVTSVGDPFRCGWQVHKIYAADAKDKRSRPLVPLGGDPARGY